MAKKQPTQLIYVKCSQCQFKGEFIYENVYLCKLKVNYPNGNFSIVCDKFKKSLSL
jgi:hypothetical protein